MQQENKNQIAMWLKVLALFAYALITIITCAAVWNTAPGAFISLVAVALFATNGYIIYRKATKLKIPTKTE